MSSNEFRSYASYRGYTLYVLDYQYNFLELRNQLSRLYDMAASFIGEAKGEENNELVFSFDPLMFARYNYAIAEMRGDWLGYIVPSEQVIFVVCFKEVFMP